MGTMCVLRPSFLSLMLLSSGLAQGPGSQYPGGRDLHYRSTWHLPDVHQHRHQTEFIDFLLSTSLQSGGGVKITSLSK